MSHTISKYCKGETCRICGLPATHKVGEEIFDDDPMPIRHNLTAYVCCAHFREIMGPVATGFCVDDGIYPGAKCAHKALSPLPKSSGPVIDPSEEMVDRYWCSDCQSVVLVPKNRRPPDCPGRHLGALTAPPEPYRDSLMDAKPPRRRE